MKLRSIVLSAILMMSLLVTAAPAHAAGSAQRILVYGPSLNEGRKPLNEAILAADLGYDVRIASADKWASLTTDEFASYQAIIVGDPDCGSAYYSEDYLAPVLANRDTWSAAVTGPVISIGSDPMYHQRHDGAVAFTNNAITYAASGTTTGMYFSLSCYFGGARGGTTLKLFKGFGSFEVGGSGCANQVRISMPDHPAMLGLTDDSMSNWSCSTHEEFDSYPSDWVKLVGIRSNHKAVVIARAQTA